MDNELIVKSFDLAGERCDGLCGHPIASVPFINIVLNTIPYLWGRSVAGILLTTGHLLFATLVMMNVCGFGKLRTGPTYFIER